MKYVVYTEEKDGSHDSFICDNKNELNLNIKCIKQDAEIVPCKITDVCKVVKGEYVSIEDNFNLPIYSINW